MIFFILFFFLINQLGLFSSKYFDLFLLLKVVNSKCYILFDSYISYNKYSQTNAETQFDIK